MREYKSFVCGPLNDYSCVGGMEGFGVHWLHVGFLFVFLLPVSGAGGDIMMHLPV